MAFMVIAYILMALMAYVDMAYVVMAYVVLDCIVMAYMSMVLYVTESNTVNVFLGKYMSVRMSIRMSPHGLYSDGLRSKPLTTRRGVGI